MVFYVIVGSTFEVFCNLRPAIPIDLMILKDFVVFFHSPFQFLDVRIQVVVPSKKSKIIRGLFDFSRWIVRN